MSEFKEKVSQFLKTQLLGVISTLGETGPQSAVVAFSETPNLEIIFGTFNTTRKYKNLQKSKFVSFVIGWGDQTVQYEGVAKEVFEDEIDQIRKILLKKNPASKKYVFEPVQRFFKVSPTWIRYTDFSVTPEKIEEFRFRNV